MVKDSTRDHLLALEEQYGIAVAIEVARKSLRVGTSDGEFKKQFNGEVCEVVLEMLLQKLIREEHPDWFYIKGLILPDADNTQSEFLTEIDFVVFTPQCIYCIECKSYSGTKRISGNGTINLESGRSYDVFKQNSMHLQVLNKMIQNFCISKPPAYKMILFNFSYGKCYDMREVDAKRAFPVVDDKSFSKVLSKRTRVCWDMQGLRMAKDSLETFSKRTRAKHLKYVQGLHKECDK